MKTVGKILKESREKKGISIAKLAGILNISIQYIYAIEKGDIKNTPGDPYTLGFVKTYANYLELDTELITNIYRDETRIAEVKNVINLPGITNYSNYSLLKLGLVSIVFVTFLTVFYNFFYLQTNIDDIYALTPELEGEMIALVEEEEFKQSLYELKKFKENKSKEDSHVKNESIINNDESMYSNTYKTQNSNLVDKKSAIASVSQETARDIKNKIIIQTLADTWIQIKESDEKLIISKLMRKNEKFILNSSMFYFITTGNAGNIEILIDGKKVGKLGKKGQVLNSFKLSKDFIDN